MKYAYEDLSPDQFEKLITLLCQRLLGIAVQGFATGTDGGRDAKFVGVAEIFPSKSSPWNGTTIIQAKHTIGYNKHFSESDFYSPSGSSTVIAEELPRIKLLRDNKELDHYMLFANRRLTGNAESDIRAHISKTCNILQASIYLCGVEQLELLLKQFPEVPQFAGIDPIDSPLIVSPDDLAEVVQAFSRHMDEVSAAFDTPPTPRVPFEIKNKLNKMTVDYAKEQRKRYLKETPQIQRFLSAPENLDLMQRYESVVEEFQLKITAKRKDYQTFDEVLNYLTDLLFSRDPVLRQNRRLTRAMLFYMYWNCDIGKNEDAETE
jgi:hypothetical protein